MSIARERLTIGQLLNRASDLFPDDEALVSGDTRLTYRQLRARVDDFANGLLQLGVSKGENVALWLHNRPEWVIAFFAAVKVGAAVVPVNTRLRTADLEYVIRQSDSTTLILPDHFGGTDYLDIFRHLCPELDHAVPGQLVSERFPNLRRVVLVGKGRPTGTISFGDIEAMGKASRDSLKLTEREMSVDFDDVCLIVYTSGTTGFPKGAMHSHKVIWNMEDAAKRMGYRRGDRLVLYLPLFHVFGALAGLVMFTIFGGCLILMEVFEPRKALELMERERATLAYGIDTHFHDMMRVKDFSSFDLSSLRNGLAPLPPDLAPKVHEKFTLMSGAYGMTETTSLTACHSPDDPPERYLDSVGRPLPGFQWKIIDPETGQEVPTGQAGEFCVRGHPLMLGYYKKPEETRAVIDEDGWFHTGDLLSVDEDGYLKFVGRIKDIIRVGAESVDPVEVEQFLNQIPGVAISRVVGVPDPRVGEVVAAFVKPEEATTLSQEQIINACRGRLASFKIPRYVFFVQEFPLTPTGKVQKFKLQEMAQAALESGAVSSG